MSLANRNILSLGYSPQPLAPDPQHPTQWRRILAPALPATAIFHGQFGFLLAAGIALERLVA